jgi:hypothetical protein
LVSALKIHVNIIIVDIFMCWFNILLVSALKIHVSKSCKALLDSLGGYQMVERGFVSMKGKGEQLTYWLVDEDVRIRESRTR